MKRFKVFVFYWFPFFVWAGLIFFFSSLETLKTSDIYWREFAIKKTAHMVEYAVLSLLMFRALIKSGVEKNKSAVISFFFCFAYGLSDEYHQSFVPGREPKLRDVGFDILGSGFAMLLVVKYKEKFMWFLK